MPAYWRYGVEVALLSPPVFEVAFVPPPHAASAKVGAKASTISLLIGWMFHE